MSFRLAVPQVGLPDLGGQLSLFLHAAGVSPGSAGGHAGSDDDATTSGWRGEDRALAREGERRLRANGVWARLRTFQQEGVVRGLQVQLHRIDSGDCSCVLGMRSPPERPRRSLSLLNSPLQAGLKHQLPASLLPTVPLPSPTPTPAHHVTPATKCVMTAADGRLVSAGGRDGARKGTRTELKLESPAISSV